MATAEKKSPKDRPIISVPGKSRNKRGSNNLAKIMIAAIAVVFLVVGIGSVGMLYAITTTNKKEVSAQVETKKEVQTPNNVDKKVQNEKPALPPHQPKWVPPTGGATNASSMQDAYDNDIEEATNSAIRGDNPALKIR